jgi:hypothetical protein
MWPAAKRSKLGGGGGRYYSDSGGRGTAAGIQHVWFGGAAFAAGPPGVQPDPSHAQLVLVIKGTANLPSPPSWLVL